MEDTYERHIVDGCYGDIPLGLYMIRGDSIVLAGELDADREESPENTLKQVCDQVLFPMSFTALILSGVRRANSRGRAKSSPPNTPDCVGL